MLSRELWVVAVDIGATNLKGAVVECFSGRMVHQRQIPTEAEKGAKRVVANFFRLVRTLLSEAGKDRSVGQIEAIAYDTPGIVDLESGIVIASCENIPGFTGYDLPSELGQDLGLPVFALNDAKSFTLAEAIYGTGINFINFGLWTLGTGVGGGLFLGGKLFLGYKASAGELGHLIIDPEGPWCNQGHRGCVESLAGTEAILRLFKHELGYSTGGHSHPLASGESVKDIFKLAEAGQDRLCVETVDKIAGYLARGIGAIVKMLSLEAAIIGGKIASEDFFLKLIEDKIKPELYPLQEESFRVIRAKYHDEGGILGAAAYAAERLGYKRK